MSIKNPELNPKIPENKYTENTKDLITRLSEEISGEFDIGRNLAEELIISKSITSRDKLKTALNKENLEFSDEKIVELSNSINNAKSEITENSKLERTALIWKINKNPNYLTERFLPKNMLTEAENPTNINWHILWLCIWTLNSTESGIKLAKNICLWIVKSPYDFGLMLSWKAEYNPSRPV